MAKKGGALPAFEELELIRTEGRLPGPAVPARASGSRPRPGTTGGRPTCTGAPVRRWPAPVVDALATRAAETAHRYAAWGHRKIWAMLRADGVRVSVSSVERALRRRPSSSSPAATSPSAGAGRPPQGRSSSTPPDAAQPGLADRLHRVRDDRRRDLADPRSSSTTRPRSASPRRSPARPPPAMRSSRLELAIAEAERLLGCSLEDCVDRATGEVSPLTIVTDNGPAFKSADFVHFIARHPELRHVRTRHHAPETNGVVERFNRLAQVRAPLPRGDRRRDRPARRGRRLPRALQLGPAPRGAGPDPAHDPLPREPPDRPRPHLSRAQTVQET